MTLLVFAAGAEPWSFAVMGDDRDEPVLAPDPAGINTVVFKKLLHELVRQKPRFVLFTGDLVLGDNILTAATLETQFSNWQNLVKTEAPSLTILPVRGNHELKGDPQGKLWLKMFKPGLDANRVAYFPGEEGFSYSWSAPDHPEAVVMAVDQYQPDRIHRVNLTQLEQALQAARARKVAHIFVYAHEMAFTCAHHGDNDNMAAFPRQRDQFVDLLVSHGCEYFFAGHDHTYDWMLIQHPKWPAGRVLNQIVAGTAGAPLTLDAKYWGDHHGYQLTRLEHQQNTFGYLWVTLDDGAATNKVICKFTPLAP
jgi:hypothetical protein